MSIEHYFQSSLIEKEYKALLLNKNIKIVSFDIFDTLFFRTCGTPSCVFEITGAKDEVCAWFDLPSSFAHYRHIAEQKLKSNGKEMFLSEIYDHLPIPSSQKSRFLELELQTEHSVLRVNPQLERWIDMAYAAGKKVILISDMYLNTQQLISTALSRLKNFDKIYRVYVSCEHQKSKASGELFLHVVQELYIEATQLLHIGDNPNTDIAVPKSFGINTLYYGLSKNEKEAMHHEALYLKKALSQGNHIRTLSLLCNPYEASLERFYFKLGASIFAPILWELSHWLFECTKRFELKKLLFIMREGAVFEHYFKKLYPHIETKLLYASRKSTQFLNLVSKDIGSVNPNTFRGLKLKDIYDIFCIPLDISTLKAYADAPFDMLSSQHVETKTLLECVQEDLNTHKHTITHALKMQKKFLSDYLKTLDIDDASALIDFGGGGSILKNIHFALSSTKNNVPHTSILFYQSMRGYQNLNNLHILSFLPHSTKTATALESIARTPDFIEILLNGKHPTTIGYTHDGIQTADIPCNETSMQTIQTAFNTGVETFFHLVHNISLPPKTFEREDLACILSRLIEFPTCEEVDFLGELEYDEGRGSSHRYRIIEQTHIDQVKDQGIDLFYRSFLKNPSHTKQSFIWSQGILTKIDRDFLKPFYETTTSPNQRVIDTLLAKLDLLKSKKIMIYGAGELFKELLPYLHVRNIEIEAVIDSRAEIQPFITEGFHIISLEDALHEKQEAIILIASGVYSHNIQKKIEDFTKATTKFVVLVTS